MDARHVALSMIGTAGWNTSTLRNRLKLSHRPPATYPGAYVEGSILDTRDARLKSKLFELMQIGFLMYGVTVTISTPQIQLPAQVVLPALQILLLLSTD